MGCLWASRILHHSRSRAAGRRWVPWGWAASTCRVASLRRLRSTATRQTRTNQNQEPAMDRGQYFRPNSNMMRIVHCTLILPFDSSNRTHTKSRVCAAIRLWYRPEFVFVSKSRCFFAHAPLTADMYKKISACMNSTLKLKKTNINNIQHHV